MNIKYRADIDALRAIAVLGVLFYHGNHSLLPGGYVGVDVFFVISGFLITAILNQEINSGEYKLLGFYERRARRIFPALFVVILVSFVAAYFILLPSYLIDFSKSMLASIYFVSNVFFWREAGYFDVNGALKPLLHTWSLGVEEQYYIFFPLVLLILYHFRKIKIGVWLLFLIAILISEWMVRRNADAAFYLILSRFWELLIGSIIALNQSFLEKMLIKIGAPFSNICYLTGLLLVLCCYIFYDANTPFPGLYAAPPLMGAALMIVFGDSSSWARIISSSKFLVFVGMLSYSLYLWHQPVLAFLHHSAINIGFVFWICYLSISSVGALLTWRFVEQPFRNRKRIGNKQIWQFSALGFVFLSVLAIWGIATNGFIDRYPAHAHDLLRISQKEMATYTYREFDKVKGRAFDANSQNYKILVIGDSFAQDVFNALKTLELSGVEFRTHHISAKCGNLLLDYDIEGEVDKGDREFCKGVGWYRQPNMISNIERADMIVLASAWREWQMGYIQESLGNIRKRTGKPILIYGTKKFKQTPLETLLDVPAEERNKFVFSVDPVTQKINASLSNVNVNGVFYIDPMAAFCDELKCSGFTKDGSLIDYDGHHLTPAGASALGSYSSSLVKGLVSKQGY